MHCSSRETALPTPPHRAAPGTKMKSALTAVLEELSSTAGRIDESLPNETLSKMIDLIDNIISTPAPRSREPLEELGGIMGDLSEAAEGTSPHHILHHHLAAYAAIAEAFAWVANPKPLAAVETAKESVKPHVVALREKKEAHADFADAIDAFFDTLLSIVKRDHATPLEWAGEDES